MRRILWENISSTGSRSYVCGHCGNSLASDRAYMGKDSGTAATVARIYICHFCSKPTFFCEDSQVPGAAYGTVVEHVPESVARLYNESRSCIQANAFTASVLCSRKLLMNIAVSKQAKEGLSFVDYVEFLSAKGYVPPDGKEWVDHIRSKGNEASHEIKSITAEEAKELIDFTHMLLKFIYEFPGKKPKQIVKA